MNKNIVLSFLALLLLLAFAPRADCALSCSFESVTGVNFGSYDVFNPSSTTATGSITFRCTGQGGTNIMTLKFNAGSGTFANRTLISVSNSLRYNLYLDSGNSQIWGDGTSGTSFFSIDPTSSGRRTVTIYGTIPVGQDVGVGNYTDTITVTMDF